MTTPKTTERARPRRGDELELEIERLAYGGAGVARAEGFVVFVRGAVPGDRVRARIGKAKRSFAEADVVELLSPSPERVVPLVPHPGAPWQVLSYQRQLSEKESQVREALERLGGFEDPPVERIVPAQETLRYRNKLEYSFGTDDHGELVLGFHRPGRWDVVERVTEDILASERVDELREAVEGWCRAEGLSAYDRSDHTGLLRNLVAREGRRTGQLQARIVTSPGDFRAPELAAALPAESVLWTRTTGVAETTRDGKTEVLKGEERIEEELLDLRFRISPDAFFQTNTEMAERLYRLAAELAGLSGRERVLDLYCGIGTIGLTLALDAAEVWGVEVTERAVADAIDNARLNSVDNAKFFAGDVRTAMRPLLQQAGKPDVVVVDPPRAGLSQKVVRRVLEAEAQKIVYVSCNPTTLAPNARQIVDAGHRLSVVRPVDMFPQTPHIECVALLEREGNAPLSSRSP
jgi:23S rRNA (uracil1939-C5)-methyltransferase